MNHHLVISLFAAAAIALPAVADDALPLVNFVPSSGESVSRTITTKTKITFTDGISISDGVDSQTLPWSQVHKITFNTSTASVNDVTTQKGRLRLRENPVADRLIIEGVPDAPASLSIYSITGTRHIHIPVWKGEDVDVADLPAGIYLLSINHQTIKFIKK